MRLIVPPTAATRLQQGKLRPLPGDNDPGHDCPCGGCGFYGNRCGRNHRLISSGFEFSGGIRFLRLLSLVVVVGAAAATIFLEKDFSAILALGALGLAMAIIFVLEPAPDVALVQIVVDILSLVILVLALTRLPRAQRQTDPKHRKVDAQTTALRSFGMRPLPYRWASSSPL